jgi:hypothetical protein
VTLRPSMCARARACVRVCVCVTVSAHWLVVGSASVYLRVCLYDRQATRTKDTNDIISNSRFQQATALERQQSNDTVTQFSQSNQSLTVQVPDNPQKINPFNPDRLLFLKCLSNCLMGFWQLSVAVTQ